MEQYFKIGIITGSFGVRGEIRVFPTTDDPKRFLKLKSVYLNPPERGASSEMPSYEVTSARMNKELVILKLKGIETPEEIAKLRKYEFYVDREHAVPLGKDEYYIADLMGLAVRDEDGSEIGVLREVFQTGANDVYRIELSDGRELLLPAIRQCVLEVDVEAGFVRIHILDGLLEEKEPRSRGKEKGTAGGADLAE